MLSRRLGRLFHRRFDSLRIVSLYAVYRNGRGAGVAGLCPRPVCRGRFRAGVTRRGNHPRIGRCHGLAVCVAKVFSTAAAITIRCVAALRACRTVRGNGNDVMPERIAGIKRPGTFRAADAAFVIDRALRTRRGGARNSSSVSSVKAWAAASYSAATKDQRLVSGYGKQIVWIRSCILQSGNFYSILILR